MSKVRVQVSDEDIDGYTWANWGLISFPGCRTAQSNASRVHSHWCLELCVRPQLDA